MKEDKLMIGNWICVNGINSKVYDIAYNEQEKEMTIGILDPQGEIYRCFFGYDHIEPILLTDDFWLKNEFVYQKDDDSYILLDDYYSINAKEVNDGMWQIVVEHCEIFNDTEVCSVSYVHQLQQFLNLCGIDIEIKL